LWLRLGHCLLNKGKHNTALCGGCQEEESVEHFILRYSLYGAQREVMRNKLKEMRVQNITLKGLLSMGSD